MPTPALTRSQREELEDAALRAFGGSLSSLVNGFRITSSRGQLAAIYWSGNDEGNDVEIAVCDSRLTDQYDLRDVQEWLAAEQVRSGRTCKVHKAHSDWPIIGFSFGDTLPFLAKCTRFRRGFLSSDEIQHLRQLRSAKSPADAGAANLRAELARLRPTMRRAVIDLVYRAGISIAPWYTRADGTPAVSPRSNPSFCYEWCFGGGEGEPVLLSIWHESLAVDGGHIRLRGNLRRAANRLDDIASTSGEDPENRNRARDQARRARRFDELVALAAIGNRPVRVILNEGNRRPEEDIGRDSSVVKVRSLDEAGWRVDSYVEGSGEFDLVRASMELAKSVSNEAAALPTEAPEIPIADQFGLGSDDPVRAERNGSSLSRDPAVRMAVLQRSGGRCEFCDAPGFRMSDGRLYLETHHVIPLGQGGPDRTWNVTALCPNDHREAHFGERAETIQSELLQFLSEFRPAATL